MRSVNRIATVLLAVAGLVGGALVALQALLRALDRPAPVDTGGWLDALTDTRWHDPVVRAVAGAGLLAGLVILVAQLRRWRPVRLRADDRDGWHLHRRCVERRLADAARAVPGVRHARVQVGRRDGRWQPRVRATGDPAARAEVEFAVRRELHRLTAPRPGRIDVRLLPSRRPA
ncbi:DUF6286 domain-containing protein [Micromonospora sp. WMMD1120]|uniref:DUF6286 domain-containing protein n=1 Tax=Micromonospora sp. WMMD1120 TaxID=3016106 RepID=UPI002415BDE7|nr:DUF6286 domain-containing protein [Micromonospora sp. WMMD1120]MDG4810227.1 DUF6286 domain-containing protein [Micromonospora sp. WMMD1120]